MVTNLDFIKIGGTYPAKEELPRLDKYTRYDNLFNAKLAESYVNRIKTSDYSGIIGTDFTTIFSNPRIMNYPRAITKKTVDLMISKKPSLLSSTYEKDDKLISLEQNTNFWKKIRLAMTDVVRYGNAFVRVYSEGCNVINPKMVTIVVDPLNCEEVKHYVIGWINEVTDEKEETTYYLTLEIHSKGSYERRVFEVQEPFNTISGIKQYTLVKEVAEPVIVQTGLKGFAITHLMGYTTSDNPMEGLSEYDMFDSLVIDLCERLSQLSDVFEKHGDPSLQGSENLLSTDENGNAVFYAGEFYPLGSGDQKLEYLTWDAKSKEILQYCNTILEQIYILTDMGDGSIMGYQNGGSQGFAESGKAIRMRMASPLMKVQSLIIDNNNDIVALISDLSELVDERIEPEDIEIQWHDGLPIDWTEETNMFNARVAAGTESITYGLQRRFHMTPEQAQDEMARIIEEKKQLSEIVAKKEPEGDDIEANTREEDEKKADAENAGTSDISQDE